MSAPNPMVDMRCAACNRVLAGRDDVTTPRRLPAAHQTCKHCGTTQTLIKGVQQDLPGVVLYHYSQTLQTLLGK